MLVFVVEKEAVGKERCVKRQSSQAGLEMKLS